VALVGSAGFAAGLALADLAGDIGAGVVVVALLGDAGDVEHAVDSPVAAEVEPVLRLPRVEVTSELACPGGRPERMTPCPSPIRKSSAMMS